MLPIVARAGLPLLLKLARNKMVQTGVATAGVMEGLNVIQGIFNPDSGELGNTDPQTANDMTKTAMALLEEMEHGGIPLNGLKSRGGQPLDTNYIVIDLEKERVFPIHKYRSKKSLNAARRRGSSRGFGRARRSYSQNKYIYS